MADEINVNVNVRGNAKRELKGITAEVKKTSTAFDVFKGVLGAQAFIGGIKAIARVAISAFKSMINSAKDLEQIQTRFEILTGSVSKAKELLVDLQEFAATTPFQLPGIADAAAQLLAFGFEQEEIIDRLQVLGDIAAGSGSQLKEIALIFGQVSAAGKLTGERLLQLQERAIPIGPVLAKTLGIAESEVRDFVSKGKVSFEVFDKAVQELTSDTGLFFNGMIKQSKTLGGVLSTLGDNFDLVAADIGAQFLPAIKEAAIILIQFLQDNKEAIKEFANTIATTIPFIIVGIDTLVRSFVFLGRTVVATFNLLTNNAKIVAKAFRGDIGGALFELKNLGTEAADDLGDAFNALSEDTLLGKLAEGVLVATENFNNMTDAVDKNTEAGKRNNEVTAEFTEEQKKLFQELSKVQQKFAEEDLNNSIVALEEKRDAELIIIQQAFDQRLILEADFNAKSEAATRRAAVAISKIQTKQNAARLKDQNKFFSTAGKLQNSKTKELQAIGKGAAITQVAIDTPPAISSSFRFGASIGGPILGGIFAAIAAAAQAVQAASIAGVPLQRGGEIPPGFPNDTFNARLTTGENVTDRSTTEDLKMFLAESAGSAAILSSIDQKLSNLNNRFIVQIGNETIIDTIRNAQDEGLVFA